MISVYRSYSLGIYWRIRFIFILYFAMVALAPINAQEILSYREIAQFDTGWTTVASLDWNQDSTALAFGMCGVEEIRILDITSGDYEVITTQSRCAKLDWDRGGGLLAIADNSPQCNTNQILIWQPQTQQIVHTHETRSCIRSIQWNVDGTQLLIYAGINVQIWDIETDRLETILEINERWIEAVALSPDDTKLAFANNHTREDDTLPSVDVMDIASGEIFHQFTDEGSPLLELQDLLSWSPQGNMLAALLTDLGGRGSAVFWDVESEERVFRSRSNAIAWHPTENYVALNILPDDAGQGDYENIFIREIGGDVLAILEGHTDQVNLLAWNPDGTLLASASLDHTIRIWEIQFERDD